jgi:hypothetical protein
LLSASSTRLARPKASRTRQEMFSLIGCKIRSKQSAQSQHAVGQRASNAMW